MPRFLKGFRRRGQSYYFRVRTGPHEKEHPLGRDFDRAVKQALKMTQRIKAGLPPIEERKAILTVEDAVKSWLEDHVKVHRHGAFAENTRWRCEHVLLPFIGNEPLESVTTRTLFKYRN